MDYTGTVSNDTANEESFTLTSMVKPILMNDTRGFGSELYFGVSSSAVTNSPAVQKTAAADM